MFFVMIRKRGFFIISTLVCIKNGVFFTYGLQIKTKKPDTFVSGFHLPPPLGESYKFDAMIAYLTIRKTNV